MEEHCPYETLGVDREASETDIKKAYRKLALREHPDKGGCPERFQAINQAYNVLSNPRERSTFEGARGRASPGNDMDIFSQFFGEDDDFFGGSFDRAFSRQRGLRDPFRDPFSGGRPFDDFFGDSFFSLGSSTSVSTTTTIKNGKRVTKTTKTVRHPDGRVETSESSQTSNSTNRRPLPNTTFGRNTRLTPTTYW